jgi:alpha-glucosidase
VGKVWPGDSVFPDFTRDDVRRWWGGLYRNFADIGIRGFWNDMNEPAVFVEPSKTMPLDAVHHVDGRVTDHREIHNIFGMANARATYEGLLQLQTNLRPFVLTRAAYAGTQRYAATWTGDNSSTWNHLRLSLPTLLNLGVSGYAFVGDDIGGFVGSPTPELLTRWIEVGAFNPLYRNHTMKGTADQEPWVHNSEQEIIRRRYIEMRYQLLPYIYTSMEEATRTGIPIMRPMFLEFPDQLQLTTADHEYMFGSDFLIAPKIVETIDSYSVILPKGFWYNYQTGEPIEGGRSINVSPPLDQLPIYVRAGAIIPQQPLIQSTDEVPKGALELHVYPGPNCNGSLYVDDGNTLNYKAGAFLRTKFTCEISPASLRLYLGPMQSTYKPWWQHVEITIINVTTPRQVTVNGKRISSWKFDPASKTLSLTLAATSTPTEVLLTR